MLTIHVPCHSNVHCSTFQETKQSQKLYINPSSSSSLCSCVIAAKKPLFKQQTNTINRRLLLSNSIIISTIIPATVFSFSAPSSASTSITEFSELPDSGGVKALDLRLGSGSTPVDGDQVAIHYYGRLAAKQGWRFDSTYDHKDATGEPVPFKFILGCSQVISGIEAAVRSMKVGGIRRVIIPPSQGYQNTTQEPLPPNFFDRQRLFTTIFNPTRLANGEGSTLGTLIFDIELMNIKHY